jgi:hypothetical protein
LETENAGEGALSRSHHGHHEHGQQVSHPRTKGCQAGGKGMKIIYVFPIKIVQFIFVRKIYTKKYLEFLSISSCNSAYFSYVFPPLLAVNLADAC